MESPAIAISGAAALECVRALAAGLSDEARAKLLADSLPIEVRERAFKEVLREIALITPDEAGALVKWTGSGFLRVANQDNCPSVKLGHKQPPLYRVADVDDLLKKRRVWPKGKPADLVEFPAQSRAA